MAKTSIFKLPILFEQLRIFVPCFDKRLPMFDITGVQFQDALPFRITGLLNDGRLFRLEIISRAKASLFIDEEKWFKGGITWRSFRINNVWKFKLFFVSTQGVQFMFKLLANIVTGEIYLSHTNDTFLEMTTNGKKEIFTFRRIDFSCIITERFPNRLPSLAFN